MTLPTDRENTTPPHLDVLRELETQHRQRLARPGQQPSPAPTARKAAAALDLPVDQVLDIVLSLETLGYIERDHRPPTRLGDGADRFWWRLTPAGAQHLAAHL